MNEGLGELRVSKTLFYMKIKVLLHCIKFFCFAVKKYGILFGNVI